jgi:hypothetical protein
MRYSKLGYWGTTGTAIGLALAGMLFVMNAMPPAITWLKLGVLSGVIALAYGLALLTYRSADEVILQTHKTAWFWGTMAALGFVGPLVIGIAWHLIPMPMLAHSARALMHLPARNDPQSYFIEGMVFLALLELTGFLIAWAVHTVRSRSQ